MALLAKVLTVSTSVAAGAAEDRGGAAIAEALEAAGFTVLERSVCPDGTEGVATELIRLAEGFSGLLVTTGGTGFSPSDTTPEATRAVLEREAPGLAEAMRQTNRLGRLSRAVAGTRGRTLILNTPGSPAGACDYLDAVLDVVPHALDLLAGGNPHPHAEHAHADHIHDDHAAHDGAAHDGAPHDGAAHDRDPRSKDTAG